jgi:hypothetical protein
LKGPQVNIPSNTTKYFGDTGVQWTNSLGQTITAGTNSTGVYYGAAWQDVYNYAQDSAAAATPAVLLQFYGDAATATNNVVFTFVRSADGTSYSTNTLDDVHWAVTVLSRGTALSTVVTNVPSWLVTGSKTIRLYSVSTTGSGAGNTILTKTALAGFVP